MMKKIMARMNELETVRDGFLKEEISSEELARLEKKMIELNKTSQAGWPVLMLVRGSK